MRLLCDRHVPPRYIDTFCRADWLTVTQVSEHLPIDADDSEIIAHAEAHDWVVFTGDKRFLMDDESDETHERHRLEPDCGLIFYDQRRKPSAGELLDALKEIARSHTDHGDIETWVPGNWS